MFAYWNSGLFSYSHMSKAISQLSRTTLLSSAKYCFNTCNQSFILQQPLPTEQGRRGKVVEGIYPSPTPRMICISPGYSKRPVRVKHIVLFKEMYIILFYCAVTKYLTKPHSFNWKYIKISSEHPATHLCKYNV